MIIFSILKSLPFQLIICLFVGFFLGETLPLHISNYIFTISCLIKDLLAHFIPFVIFTYLWAAIVSFGNRGLLLISSTFILIIVANLVALFTAYGVGNLLLPHIVDSSIQKVSTQSSDSLISLWNISDVLHFGSIQPLYGLIGGIFFGFLTIALSSQLFSSNIYCSFMALRLKSFSEKSRVAITHILKFAFVPVIPIYVLGFVLKLSRDGHLAGLIQGYAHTFILTCVLIVLYLCFWYGVGSHFNANKTFSSIRNMMPAGFLGFTTMSSSATLPVTLIGVEKNIKDPTFANFFAPATVNSHLVGDGLSITITAMALLLMSGQNMPSLSVFMIFAIQYCFVKFSAAGIPGGGVLVILPVARDYLGLDEALMPLLQTIYMLQDPILTSSNIMGNGAFSMVAHRLMKPWMKH